MRAEDFVGLGVLFFKRWPNVRFVRGFLGQQKRRCHGGVLNEFLLGFPAGFRKALGGEEVIGVPRGKRERGGVIG